MGQENDVALETIFLDLDHTLCDTDQADVEAHGVVCARVRERFPAVDGPALAAAYGRCIYETPLDPSGREPVSAWRIGLWARVLGEQDPGLAPLAEEVYDLFSSARMEFLEFFPGVESLLSRLRTRHRTWVITNGDSSIQWPKVRALDLAAHVDGFVVSGDRGIHKPDPRIFLEACRNSGCEPAEAIHVGNSLKSDVRGANDAGLLASVWVNARGRGLEPGDPRPSFEIRSVLELEAIVDRIEALE